MSLNRLFPDNEIFRSPITGIPPVWEHLMAMPRAQALSSLAENLGVAATSRMYRAVTSATDLGIVAPGRKRDRKKSGMWTMAVLYAPSLALVFRSPSPDLLFTTLSLPAQYIEVVSTLGILHFDQYSGALMWPVRIVDVSQDITLAMMNGMSQLEVLPFFDHLTGDFDCWLLGEGDTSFVFDHEACRLRKYCDGGFAKWMEKRFEEYVMS